MKIKLNKIFASAAEAARMKIAPAAVVKDQPGYNYRLGTSYQFCRTEKGGIRLYCDIDAKCMDASLQDIK